MTSSKLAALMPNNGDSVVILDKRDNNDYQVTNIGGRYWMTQNLRVTGTITSDLSNFNSGSIDIPLVGSSHNWWQKNGN